MDKRLTFNVDAKNYDKWRPAYCEKLFEDVIQYSHLNAEKKAVEIGIGTGQATLPFLQTQCDLTAIELGQNLAEYCKVKFNSFPRFHIENISFEDYICLPGSIDLIYSATAFHWIAEKTAYTKVFDLLKCGGTLALFWNKPSPQDTGDDLNQEIQKLYKKYASGFTKPPAEEPEQRYKRIQQTITSYGFIDLQFNLYHAERNFTAHEYVGLLNTYSDHRSRPAAVKQSFENELLDLIQRHGNRVEISDTIDLYMARKPQDSRLLPGEKQMGIEFPRFIETSP